MSGEWTPPMRISDSGDPLNDTWSDYGREHQWAGWVPVVEEGIEAQWSRVNIYCERCRQERRVWHGISTEHIRWGCPRIPLWYRMRLRGKEIPRWGVNSRPPWAVDDMFKQQEATT